ncbi:MAG: hypothetical protein J6X03_03550 [Bacilli bacterium]|nr:hypothetical protein [Bacilli bacterium]
MRVMCTKCGKVITCYDTDKSVFCNECGNNFLIEDGANLLNKQYKAYIDRANRFAYQLYDHEKAIHEFQEALKIKPNDFTCVLGIILSTLSYQKLDDLKFNQVQEILNSYDIALNGENTFLYLNLVDDIIKQIHVFYSSIRGKFMKEGKFINEQYLRYYRDGLDDILSTLNYLKENFEICDEVEFKEFNESNNIPLKVDDEIKAAEERKKDVYSVSDKQIELEDLTLVEVTDEQRSLIKRVYLALGLSLLVAIGIIIAAAITKINYIYIGLILPAAFLFFVISRFRKKSGV